MNVNTMSDWDDTPLHDSKSWPEEESTHPMRIVKVEERTGNAYDGAAKGWTSINVKLEVANGELMGKPIFMTFRTDPPRDANGKVVPNANTVAKHYADLGDYGAAAERAVEGSMTAASIGRRGFLKLMNAAGFIREKDVRPGDKNMRRIDDGLAVKIRNTTDGYVIIGDDGNPTGTIFQPQDLERRLVMAKTVPATYKKTLETGETVERVGRDIKSVWDVNPAEIGDLAEAAPF